MREPVERDILLSSSGWLNDKPINSAHTLLAKQFPQYHGIQHTIRQSTGGYRPSESPFVQIILVENKHWICTSSLKCNVGEVNVFDSLGYLLSVSVYHACCITNKKTLTLKRMDVQILDFLFRARQRICEPFQESSAKQK